MCDDADEVLAAGCHGRLLMTEDEERGTMVLRAEDNAGDRTGLRRVTLYGARRREDREEAELEDGVTMTSRGRGHSRDWSPFCCTVMVTAQATAVSTTERCAGCVLHHRTAQ